MSFYDYSVFTPKGEEISMAKFKSDSISNFSSFVF